ncbi:MAG: DUF5668 domain-containing protein [Sphingobacteriales bacterium]|nr:DUF5668 domain-containing protein [Sphingobacteriales bacterium]
MNSRKLIWGSFLILIGLILVVHNFNLLPITINWGKVASLWPLMLIMIGLSSLSKNTSMNPWIFNGIAAIVISIFFYQIIEIGEGNTSHSFSWSDSSDLDSADLKTQKFNIPLEEGVTNAHLTFEGGAAEFILNDTTSNLIDAITQTRKGDYVLEKVRTDSVDDIKMKLNSNQIKINNGNIENQVEVKLNPKLKWSFDFEIGAGAIDFDFSNYIVNKISLDAGAASVNMKLSDKASITDVDINAGASSVTLRVPKSARCRVQMDAVLSSEDLTGFTKKTDGYYESDNYNGKGNLINITVDAGMSSVTIERY